MLPRPQPLPRHPLGHWVAGDGQLMVRVGRKCRRATKPTSGPASLSRLHGASEHTAGRKYRTASAAAAARGPRSQQDGHGSPVQATVQCVVPRTCFDYRDSKDQQQTARCTPTQIPPQLGAPLLRTHAPAPSRVCQRCHRLMSHPATLFFCCLPLTLVASAPGLLAGV